MNAIVHTENSMKRYGGIGENDFNKFLQMHKKMDCSKAYFSDNRHRALSHTYFWINEVMLPIFGDYITLDSGKKVSVKEAMEFHILEDFRLKFIPTVQDYLQEMEMKKWMQNGMGIPESAKKLYPELKPNQPATPTEEEIESDRVKRVLENTSNLPEINSEEVIPSNPQMIRENDWKNMVLDGNCRPSGLGRVLD